MCGPVCTVNSLTSNQDVGCSAAPHAKALHEASHLYVIRGMALYMALMCKEVFVWPSDVEETAFAEKPAHGATNRGSLWLALPPPEKCLSRVTKLVATQWLLGLKRAFCVRQPPRFAAIVPNIARKRIAES